MVDIGIIDNPPLEPIEVFFGELTTSFSTVELDPQRANISIIDNDGKLEGCIESTLRNTFMYNQAFFFSEKSSSICTWQSEASGTGH